MKVTSEYEIPFKEYDWRTTLFHHFYNYFTQAAVEIIVENEPEGKFDWNNHGGILEYAVIKGYFNKVGERAMKLAADRLEQDS